MLETYFGPCQTSGSHRECSVKQGILKHFANFTGKHLCWGLVLISCRPRSVTFSKVAGEIFKNIHFEKHKRTTVSI